MQQCCLPFRSSFHLFPRGGAAYGLGNEPLDRGCCRSRGGDEDTHCMRTISRISEWQPHAAQQDVDFRRDLCRTLTRRCDHDHILWADAARILGGQKVGAAPFETRLVNPLIRRNEDTSKCPTDSTVHSASTAARAEVRVP